MPMKRNWLRRYCEIHLLASVIHSLPNREILSLVPAPDRTHQLLVVQPGCLDHYMDRGSGMDAVILRSQAHLAYAYHRSGILVGSLCRVYRLSLWLRCGKGLEATGS